MVIVEVVSGREILDKQAELRCQPYYINHERCPLKFKTVSKTGLASENTSITLSMISKWYEKNAHTTGAPVLRKVNYTGPFYLDSKHQALSRTGLGDDKNTAWYRNTFDMPEGLIFKVNIMALIMGVGITRGISRYNANIYLRVRECAPFIEMNFKQNNGFGHEFLIKGRLDRLSAEYVLKNKLIKHPAEVGTLGEDLINRFVQYRELMPALVETNQKTSETIQADGKAIEIVRTQKIRKIHDI